MKKTDKLVQAQPTGDVRTEGPCASDRDPTLGAGRPQGPCPRPASSLCSGLGLRDLPAYQKLRMVTRRLLLMVSGLRTPTPTAPFPPPRGFVSLCGTRTTADTLSDQDEMPRTPRAHSFGENEPIIT